jgi:hypothetical protein
MLMRYHWGLAVGHIYSHMESKSQHTHHIDSLHGRDVEGAVDDDATQHIKEDSEGTALERGEVDDDIVEKAISEQDEQDSDISNYGGGSGEDDVDDVDDVDLLEFDEMYGDQADYE